MFKETFEVFVFDEYYEGPTHAIIELSDEELNEIFRLRQILINAPADKICLYDGTPEMISIDEETEEESESDCSMYCEMLNIYKNIITWSFLIKRTDIRGEVSPIYFSALEEYIKVRDLPLEDLPPLINDEFKLKSTKNLITGRLSESTR